MKKTMAWLGAFLMVFSMAGCGGSSEVVKPSSVSAQTQEAAGSGASDEGGESKADEGSAGATDGQGTEAQQDTEASAASGKETIEETVLLDEGGLKVTAKSLDKNALMGPEIKLLIDNESGKDLTVQTRNVSINGYMVDTMMSADVVSGKKANDSLTFMRSDLQACGIDTIADMEFSFHVFETSNWHDYLNSDPVVLKTSAAEGYNYVYDDSGDVAYTDDNLKIVIKGLSNDSLLGPGVVVYIANTGSQDVTVQAKDVSINGFMIDPIFSADVCVGKHAVDSITFMSSNLKDNGIDKIEKVELSFHVFTTNGWDTVVDTDPVTITF